MRYLVGKENTTDPTNEKMNTTSAHAEEGQRLHQGEYCHDPTAEYPHEYVCAEHKHERLEELYEYKPCRRVETS